MAARIVSTALILGSLTLCAEEPAPAAPAEAKAAPQDVKDLVKPEKIGPHSFRIGKITLNSQERSISFPAEVNMNEGMIEFPVTHTNGRVHEAIFITDVLPIQLQTALLLNHFETSQETFAKPLKEPYRPGVKLPPPEYPDANPKAHIKVSVSWKKDGKEHHAPLETMLVRQGETPDEWVPYSKSSDYWVFTGSTEKMGAKVPDMAGAMVGTRLAYDCIMNPLPHDDVAGMTWVADPDNIPAVATKVTIHLQPAKPAKTTESSPTKD